MDALNAPNHVKNFAFYGAGNNVNADIPAAYMAAHVDIVEDDGGNESFSASFKAAGGKTALAYTDPTYVPYCPPPFTAPAGLCAGPIGRLVASDGSAWVHDANGARIHRAAGTAQYQEVLNAGSPSAVSAYAQTVSALLALSPQLDGVFADDSGSPLSSLYSGFNAPGVEFQTDDQWIAGESAMLAAPGIKVLYNGGNPQGGPAYGGAFLDLPQVIGQTTEDCFSGGTTLRTDQNGYFQNDANGLLQVQAHRKLAVCLPVGPVDPDSRTYAYAAFMLIYDPLYSVFGADTVLSDNEAIYPEMQLVPLQPLKTAASDVGVLRQGSVYVREFAACAIGSSSVGGCAAVLNSSASSAAVPALTQSYAHSIALDPQSLYHGGRARVVAGIPSSLAAGSAAILVR